MEPRLFAELDEAIAGASASDRPGLVVALAARLAALGAALAIPAEPALAKGTENNLSIEEGARRLGVSPAYLYRHPDLPFIVKIGRRRLVDVRALEKFNRRQAGKD